MFIQNLVFPKKWYEISIFFLWICVFSEYLLCVSLRRAARRKGSSHGNKFWNWKMDPVQLVHECLLSHRTKVPGNPFILRPWLQDKSVANANRDNVRIKGIVAGKYSVSKITCCYVTFLWIVKVRMADLKMKIIARISSKYLEMLMTIILNIFFFNSLHF